jgi:O-antigen ligase
VAQRLQAEPEAWQALMQLEFDQTSGNIGRRFTIWQVGGELVAERPLWGWGPGRTHQLIRERGPEAIHGRNLHNFFLHVTASFGLVGLAATLTVIGALARTLWISRRERWLSWDMAMLIAAAGALFVIVNCVDLHYYSPHMMAYIVLLSGIASTGWLRSRALAEQRADTASPAAHVPPTEPGVEDAPLPNNEPAA